MLLVPAISGRSHKLVMDVLLSLLSARFSFEQSSDQLAALLAMFASPGPIVFEVGPITVRWYGLLIATAVLLGATLSQFLAKRRGINPDLVGDCIIWLVIGAIPCARLYYVLFEWDNYAQNPVDAFAIWKGGIAIHGAIIGGMLAGLVFSRLNKVSFWEITDLIAPSLILGQAIGRWGNFFNSEAFGDPTNLPWKLFIPLESRPSGLESVAFYHPTFLYESVWNVGVFILLMTLFFRGEAAEQRTKPGTLFMVYMITYSLGRVWIEGLRTDSLMLGPLRIAQVVSLVAIALGSLGLVWLYGLHRRLPDVVPASGHEG